MAHSPLLQHREDMPSQLHTLPLGRFPQLLLVAKRVSHSTGVAAVVFPAPVTIRWVPSSASGTLDW